MKSSHFLPISAIVALLCTTSAQAIEDKRLNQLYDKENPDRIWIVDGEWTPCAQRVLGQLRQVADDGLDPDDFLPLLDKLEGLNLDDSSDQKEADELLSVAALDYISDMKGERLYPRKIDRQLYYRPVDIDEVSILKDNMASDGRSCNWVTQLEPQRADYKELKGLLAEYRNLKEMGYWPTLPKGTKLKAGDSGPKVQTLRELLTTQGYLSPSQGQGDTFDSTVEAAVKEYQRLHGLEPDGAIGPMTAKSMSTSLDERIKRVIVSMERQRWLPENMGDRYIQVNIPAYELKAVENDQVQFTMPVITGRHYRETPNYSREMTGVRFNPSWHVPYSIAVADKLPKLKRNSGAFSGRGYRYYDSYGNRVDPGSIDWGSYSSGNFPFTIKQSPGAGNALGKIRFTLENKNGLAIFLHGTPSKHLWEKAKRSFSSGCIRVKDPHRLAEFVFNNPDEWPRDRIDSEASGYNTNNVSLPQPLKTQMTYFTIWVDEAGKTHFVEDVYGQDKQIWNALQEHKRKYRL